MGRKKLSKKTAVTCCVGDPVWHNGQVFAVAEVLDHGKERTPKKAGRRSYISVHPIDKITREPLKRTTKCVGLDWCHQPE